MHTFVSSIAPSSSDTHEEANSKLNVLEVASDSLVSSWVEMSLSRFRGRCEGMGNAILPRVSVRCAEVCREFQVCTNGYRQSKLFVKLRGLDEETT